PADELVADHQPGLDRALAPFVPQVDVQVGAADGGFLELDQDLVRTRLRDRDFLHPDALGGFALDERLHGRGDLRGLAGDWRHGVAGRSEAGARLYRPAVPPAPAMTAGICLHGPAVSMVHGCLALPVSRRDRALAPIARG